jgi:hypothetical protein
MICDLARDSRTVPEPDVHLFTQKSGLAVAELHRQREAVLALFAVKVSADP